MEALTPQPSMVARLQMVGRQGPRRPVSFRSVLQAGSVETQVAVPAQEEFTAAPPVMVARRRVGLPDRLRRRRAGRSFPP